MTGTDHYPQNVTASMGKKKPTKRPKNKTFMKVCKYNHLMPTGSPWTSPWTRMSLEMQAWNASLGRRSRSSMRNNIRQRRTNDFFFSEALLLGIFLLPSLKIKKKQLNKESKQESNKFKL